MKGITIEELWTQYMQHATVYYRKPSGRPTREADNMQHAFRGVLHLYGDVPAEEFTPSKLRHVQQRMVSDDLARNTINARTNRIRRVFKWAVSMELISPHRLAAIQCVAPLKRGRTTARETSPITPVEWSSVSATIMQLTQPTRCIIEVLWFTGMRVGEALAMRPIDLEQTNQPWLYTPKEHKTEHHGYERIIPLGPKAMAIVQQRLDSLAMLLFPDENTHVFEFNNGHRHNRTSLRDAVRRACGRAQISPWTPLQLRHAAATRLRDAMGIEAARVVLGHSSAGTTEIYAQVDREKARSMMQQFG